MPPLSLWKGVGVKTNDFKLIDRAVSEQFRIGGTEFYIHKLTGVVDQGNNEDNNLPVNLDQTDGNDPLLTIQDVLNMENRDRSYDKNVYSLKGHYLLSDTEFDLRQFGLFLSNDTIFITFHLNDMVDKIGRKLISGDVIEILHQRDDLVLGSNGAINKFYLIDEGTKPASGYGPSWWPHVWRVKCNPITDSQEFRDILDLPALDASGDPISNNKGGESTIRDLISNREAELKINDAIVKKAEEEVPFVYFQSQHFYILPKEDPNIVGMDIWTGNGIPPNESKPVDHGNIWPTKPLTGDYFLNVSFSPPQLFKWEKTKWVRIETDFRNKWLPTNHKLGKFINNDNKTTLTDGTTLPERQNLRKTIRPKLDPDII